MSGTPQPRDLSMQIAAHADLEHTVFHVADALGEDHPQYHALRAALDALAGWRARLAEQAQVNWDALLAANGRNNPPTN